MPGADAPRPPTCRGEASLHSCPASFFILFIKAFRNAPTILPGIRVSPLPHSSPLRGPQPD